MDSSTQLEIPITEEAAKPVKQAPKTVTLKGRVIEVKRPTDEQLFAWDQVLRRMEAMGKNIENTDQARKLINKCMNIVNAVIANEDDRDWLEDGRLDGSITLQDAGELVLDALKVYEFDTKPAAPKRGRPARRAKA